MFGGLHTKSMAFMLDFLVDNKFNGIRVPLSLDMVLNPNARYPNSINYNENPDLQGLTSIQVLDKFFDGARARNILILLDQHR